MSNYILFFKKNILLCNKHNYDCWSNECINSMTNVMSETFVIWERL